LRKHSERPWLRRVFTQAGSKGDISQRPDEVCFTPNSGHRTITAAKYAHTGRNDVNLVLLVRLLRIHFVRSEQFDAEVATVK
jgi:hypothetical protein